MRNQRVASLLVLLAIVLPAGACGGGQDSPVGEWREDTGLDIADELGLPVATRRRAPMECGFEADGTCWASVSGARFKGRWEQDGETVNVTADRRRHARYVPDVALRDGLLHVSLEWRGKTWEWVFSRK